MNNKKNNRLIISIIAFLILSVIAASMFGLSLNKKKALEGIHNSLVAVRDATSESLSVFITNKASTLENISNNKTLVTMVENLLKLPANKSSITSSNITKDIRDYYSEYKNILSEQGFFIINNERISVSSMRDTNIGTINLIHSQRPELLNRVFNGESVFIPPIYSDIPIHSVSPSRERTSSHTQATMFIASPIRNHTGEVIAAFTIRLDPGKQFSQIMKTGRIGNTGETYAIDSTGLLLSESRFEKELKSTSLLDENETSALSIRSTNPSGNIMKGYSPGVSDNLTLTTMAMSVTQGHSNINTSGYRDYRGVYVFGAWKWLPHLGIGLATEIDVEQALHAYYISRNIIITIIGVLLLITTGTLVIIMMMANRANKILQHSHDDLEFKIAERTKDILSSEKNFRDILESSPIGVLTMSLDGFIKYANAQATKIMRCENMRLLTKNAYDFYQDKQARDSLIKKFKTNGFIHNEEVKLLRDDTSKAWALMSFIATKHENEEAILVWFADITARKEYESNLSEAKDQAERANEAKSSFLSAMSHELRTPLNAILGFSQILEMYSEDDEVKSSVTEIRTAGNHLLNLINDILDLATIESGKLSLSVEDVNLKDIYAACLSLMVPLAAKRDITILSPTKECIEYIVEADYMRLKQVLLNLLSNAVKYNKVGGNITISCESCSDSKLRINITDTGSGMSDQQLHHLFQEFNRVGAEQSGIEGTGIGLVITKRLIELMGGSIGVESRQGKGSTFWIELTASQNTEFSNHVNDKDIFNSNKQEITANRKKTILYIEDNPANLRLITRIIAQHTSYNLISAMEGRTGIDLAVAQLPDLILLDINLPYEDGYAVLKQLREIEVTHDIPVIAVSANAMNDDIAKGNEAGFTDYITKPVNFQKLIDAINKALD